MKDLGTIRKNLSAKVQEFDGTQNSIPDYLKRALIKAWERAESIRPGYFVLKLQKGKGSEDLTDTNLIKCIYARELLEELLKYRNWLQKFLDKNSINQSTAEDLCAKTNKNNMPLWWPSVEKSINNSELSTTDKEQLIKFASTNSWSGCTKGVGRKDFFHSSVVNALLSNVTHNGILADVTKDLMDLNSVVDPILSWFESNENFISKDFLEKNLCLTALPKPFLLLAGISGTGKTRFVREQAKAAAVPHGMTKGENYCLVPVRPDWHEPSDLLGYISRIGNSGARYVTTDLLRFIVAAWKHAAQDASTHQITQKVQNTICPYWLCLDEMNLAPVEQYFADYLSILETRTWKNGTYSCEPLLKPVVINQQLDETGRKDLWVNLGISDDDPLSKGLQDYFLENGIPLPPNLIVAGTVNMDETTHGFSRKVIDRALTFDFGEFFPNDYQHYFEDDKVTDFKFLGFSHLSEIRQKGEMAGVASDPAGNNTIKFLSAVNAVLAGTPFELAYRALNEALLAVVCFNPADEAELQAVWDDFLMMKVLPRIEGDAEKLGSQDDISLLTRLSELLKVQFSQIVNERRDLLNQSAKDGSAVKTVCRSLKKLEWMQKRLTNNGFTSFWP